MNALTKLKKKQWVNLSALELCVSENNMEKFVRVKAAAELAALIVERDELRHAIRSAQIQLRATQENWREDCLFNCNDILTAALKGESK